MNFYFVGWLASIIIWMAFLFGFIWSYKRGDRDTMERFNILQIITLIPIWVFVFLSWGR